MSEAKSAAPILDLLARAAVCAALAAAAAPLAGGPASAQGISNTGGRFNSGWNGMGSSAVLNNPVNVATRDENNNQIFVNGVMQTPEGSVFSNTSGFSQSGSSGGVGGTGLATAVGNSLNVVVQGSYNMVNVDSTQINNGAVTANATLNGQIKLEGP